MDDVKRKVLLDLFASPSTLLPIAGGLTLLMGSWAVGGSGLFSFAGVASILGGLGLFATRLLFGLERITDEAHAYLVQKQQAKQKEALEELDRKLVQDRDPRTQSNLRELRSLYSGLKEDLHEGRIAASSRSVLDGIDRLFHVCVEHLSRSFELWESSRKVDGRAKDQLLRQRDELVREVEESVKYLRGTVAQMHSLSGRKKKSELAQLRKELDESIEAARRAEQRMAEWTGDTKQYDPSEFES